LVYLQLETPTRPIGRLHRKPKAPCFRKTGNPAWIWEKSRVLHVPNARLQAIYLRRGIWTSLQMPHLHQTNDAPQQRLDRWDPNPKNWTDKNSVSSEMMAHCERIVVFNLSFLQRLLAFSFLINHMTFSFLSQVHSFRSSHLHVINID